MRKLQCIAISATAFLFTISMGVKLTANPPSHILVEDPKPNFSFNYAQTSDQAGSQTATDQYNYQQFANEKLPDPSNAAIESDEDQEMDLETVSNGMSIPSLDEIPEEEKQGGGFMQATANQNVRAQSSSNNQTPPQDLFGGDEDEEEEDEENQVPYDRSQVYMRVQVDNYQQQHRDQVQNQFLPEPSW
eukprot:403342228